MGRSDEGGQCDGCGECVDRGSTRQRVLGSAAALFARQGYRDTTIAEICEAADANIAAVNYHFGGKERLYEEVVRWSVQVAEERFPADGGVAADACPEERLRGFVSALLHRILDTTEAAFSPQLILREIVSPTAAFDKILVHVIEPTTARLDMILREMVPEATTGRRLFLCRVCVIGQCVFLNFTRDIRGRVVDRWGIGEPDPEELIAQSTEFVLGGLAALRARWREADGGPESSGRPGPSGHAGSNGSSGDPLQAESGERSGSGGR